MMSRICRWSPVVLAMALLAGAQTPALAQITGTVAIHSSSKSSSSKAKPDKFQGRVIFSTSTAITVRSLDNERMIRTFTYAPAARDRMEKILDQGGYQYGDKVEIFYKPGTDIALRIKGKPSKPL